MTQHQHTVPVSYLRGFADEDGLLSIRRRSGQQADIGVRDATVRRNFYSFRDQSGRWDDVMENWFATNVESPAAQVLARLLSTTLQYEADPTGENEATGSCF